MPPPAGVSQVAGTVLYAVKSLLNARAADVKEWLADNFQRKWVAWKVPQM